MPCDGHVTAVQLSTLFLCSYSTNGVDSLPYGVAPRLAVKRALMPACAVAMDSRAARHVLSSPINAPIDVTLSDRRAPSSPCRPPPPVHKRVRMHSQVTLSDRRAPSCPCRPAAAASSTRRDRRSWARAMADVGFSAPCFYLKPYPFIPGTYRYIPLHTVTYRYMRAVPLHPRRANA